MSNEERRIYESEWHLDKRLNVGHLLMTLSIAVGAFMWASSVDVRVQSNTDAIIHHKELVASKQVGTTRALDKLDIKMDKMDEKIDRVLYSIDITHTDK